MPKFGGGAEPCTLCSKSVYPAELVKTTAGYIFHKQCFRCTKCNVLLSLAGATEHPKTGRLYCKPDWSKLPQSEKEGESGDLPALARKEKKVEKEEALEDLHVEDSVWVDLQDVKKAFAPLEATKALRPPVLEGATPEPYVRGKITAVAADTYEVLTDQGAKASVKKAHVRQCDASGAGGGLPNNLMLVNLNEPSLLQNIRARFARQQAYTYTGEMELLALNPYEIYPGTYDQSAMERYKGAKAEDLEPHIFAVAERIFVGLKDKGVNAQSVVVSGESGAGKTEANKHVLHYLRFRAGHDDVSTTIARVIELSNVLLEALGNAKTTNNKNSSRFGKYLEIAFDTSGACIGGKFKTFLLEKSRVTKQAPLERNFHAFYLMCAGDEATRREFSLRGADQHDFTQGTVDNGGKEKEQLDELLQALADAKMEPSQLFGTLAAILHLGDVTFAGDERGCAVDSAGAGPLGSAAKLLGIEPSEVELHMTTRWISAGPGDEVEIKLSPEVSSQSRDAVVKAIYQRLFLYFVHQLNALLLPSALKAAAAEAGKGGGGKEAAAKKPDRKAGRRGSLMRRMSSMGGAQGGANSKVVGLLDIFGFESLATNGFEQLCINFANERLHALFLSSVFQGLPEEQLKSVLGADDGRIDNRPCLAMLGEPPDGILHLLDFMCKAPKATDSTFCVAVNAKHERSPFLRVPRVSKACQADEKTGFVVRHFAGDILYEAGHFLELNNDSSRLNWLAADSVRNSFVSNLFTQPELQPVATAKKGFISVGYKFSQDLVELISTLQQTETHFVRCMKPNLVMQPKVFDAAFVRTRLRAAGTLASLMFLRKLMPGALKFGTIARLRKPPHLASLPKALSTPPEPLDTDAKFGEALMAALGVPKTQYAVDAAKGEVRVATSLVPFLAAMEEKGEVADAAAAAAVAKMCAEAATRTEASRREAERKARRESVKDLKAAMTIQGAGRRLSGRLSLKGGAVAPLAQPVAAQLDDPKGAPAKRASKLPPSTSAGASLATIRGSAASRDSSISSSAELPASADLPPPLPSEAEAAELQRRFSEPNGAKIERRSLSRKSLTVRAARTRSTHMHAHAPSHASHAPLGRGGLPSLQPPTPRVVSKVAALDTIQNGGTLDDDSGDDDGNDDGFGDTVFVRLTGDNHPRAPRVQGASLASEEAQRAAQTTTAGASAALKGAGFNVERLTEPTSVAIGLGNGCGLASAHTLCTHRSHAHTHAHARTRSRALLAPLPTDTSGHTERGCQRQRLKLSRGVIRRNASQAIGGGTQGIVGRRWREDNARGDRDGRERRACGRLGHQLASDKLRGARQRRAGAARLGQRRPRGDARRDARGQGELWAAAIRGGRPREPPHQVCGAHVHRAWDAAARQGARVDAEGRVREGLRPAARADALGRSGRSRAGQGGEQGRGRSRWCHRGRLQEEQRRRRCQRRGSAQAVGDATRGWRWRGSGNRPGEAGERSQCEHNSR